MEITFRMYISKKNRMLIKMKFGGLCAYSGTVLEDDWQVDHVEPVIRFGFGAKGARYEDKHCIDNMVPCQKIINHYKRSTDLLSFRNWLLGELHLRLKKLPRNPTAERSIKHKEYLLKVADLFGITEDKPFNRVFYFETINQDTTNL